MEEQKLNEALQEALRKNDVSGSALVEILKSESVYRLLRYGIKVSIPPTTSSIGG